MSFCGTGLFLYRGDIKEKALVWFEGQTSSLFKGEAICRGVESLENTGIMGNWRV